MSDEAKREDERIIVDEDWKSQVEAEKQSARPQQPSEEPQQAYPLPPPDLTFLASSLYLQAMVCMGLLPNPMSDKPKVQLDQAQHVIDTLQMLYDKTEGNRTPDETAAIDNMLHELRLAYVSVREGSERKDE